VYGASRLGIPPQVNVMGTLLFLGGVILALGNIMLNRRSSAGGRAIVPESEEELALGRAA
jgi:hypothetical protein